MTFSTSGTAKVNISGSVTSIPAFPVPSATQTLKQVNIAGSGAAKTVFTTTAGKTAYVMGLYAADSAGGRVVIFTQTDDATVVSLLSCSAANVQASVGNGCPMFAVPSNTNLRVTGSAAATTNIWCHYFEQ